MIKYTFESQLVTKNKVYIAEDKISYQVSSELSINGW